ncbi:MAG: sulfatase-like hydrolase/transferase [Actinomycetota bacterium]|nr:sulfatase-like hydrolase/transferase [Actinomycetota bacterium]
MDRQSLRRGARSLRDETALFLEVLVVSSFAVGQPILDVFGKSPETFVFAGAGPFTIAAFAVLVMLIPALAMWGLSAVFVIAGRAIRLRAHSALLWGLCCVLGIQVVKKLTPLLDLPLAMAGAALGTALAWVLLGPWAVRRWLAHAWPAPVAFLLIFLLVSPVSKLVRPTSASSAAVGPGGKPVPVVMVIFDQLPLLTLLDAEGNISRRRFPNFRALADDATWYRNYTVTESFTTYSVPAILSGTLVKDRSKRPVARDYPNTLFTLLGRSHRMEVFESITALCPSDLCTRRTEKAGGLAALLSEAVGIWADLSLPGKVTRDVTAQFEETIQIGADAEMTEGSRRGEDKRRPGPVRFAQFLRTLGPHSRPTLYFMHSGPPHYPWRLYPSCVEYKRTGETDWFALQSDASPARWLDQSWTVRVTRLRHVLQVMCVDNLLGDLVDRLKALGMYDDALVVITSDHGHSLAPGRPRAAMADENLHEILWVPLLVKAPGQRDGAVVDADVTAPDLLPTIAEHLGIRVPWRTDGSSALHSNAAQARTKTVIRYQDGTRVPWPTAPISITIDEAWRRLRAEAFQSNRDSSHRSLYELGPAGEFIGESVDSFPRANRPGGSARLEGALPFDSVDLERGPIPGLITGTVPAGTPGDAIIAALNGRIAGHSPIFRAGRGPLRFLCLLPDWLFRSGENNFDLFLMRRGVLHPLAIH